MSERGEEIQQETIRKRINEVISDIERQVCREEDEDRAENEVKSSAEENSVSKSCHEVNVPEKVLTPSSDGCLLIPSRRAMFVDSAFFSPAVHPTWEQQVQMAKKISTSLSHSSNRMSRGQSMYEKRKRRSQNWVHQGDGDGREEQEDLSQHPKKPLIKLLMRPNGQAYDIQALQDEDRPPASKELLSPEIFSGLVKDLSSPDCKGAQIFAKRKKRSECWIVDDLHREQRGGGRQAASDSVEPPQGPGGADVPHPQGIPSVTPFNRDGLEQNGRTKYSLKPFSLNPGERWDINSVAASSISSHEPVFSKARTEHQTPPSQGLSVFPSAEAAVNSGTRSCFSNYNTAARGWGVTSGFYRPVTFSHR